jgi:hypothetical protein
MSDLIFQNWLKIDKLLKFCYKNKRIPNFGEKIKSKYIIFDGGIFIYEVAKNIIQLTEFQSKFVEIKINDNFDEFYERYLLEADNLSYYNNSNSDINQINNQKIDEIINHYRCNGTLTDLREDLDKFLTDYLSGEINILDYQIEKLDYNIPNWRGTGSTLKRVKLEIFMRNVRLYSNQLCDSHVFKSREFSFDIFEFLSTITNSNKFSMIDYQNLLKNAPYLYNQKSLFYTLRNDLHLYNNEKLVNNYMFKYLLKFIKKNNKLPSLNYYVKITNKSYCLRNYLEVAILDTKKYKNEIIKKIRQVYLNYTNTNLNTVKEMINLTIEFIKIVRRRPNKNDIIKYNNYQFNCGEFFDRLIPKHLNLLTEQNITDISVSIKEFLDKYISSSKFKALVDYYKTNKKIPKCSDFIKINDKAVNIHSHIKHVRNGSTRLTIFEKVYLIQNGLYWLFNKQDYISRKVNIFIRYFKDNKDFPKHSEMVGDEEFIFQAKHFMNELYDKNLNYETGISQFRDDYILQRKKNPTDNSETSRAKKVKSS